MKRSKIRFLFINSVRKYYLTVGIIFFLFLVILLRWQATKVVLQEGSELQVSGTVVSIPVIKGLNQYLSISGIGVFLPRFPEIEYQDKVVVVGVVKNGRLTNVDLVKVTKSGNVLVGIRNKLSSFFERVWPQPYAGLVSGMVIGDKTLLTPGFWELMKKVGTAHVVVASGMNISFVASFVMAMLIIFLNRRIALLITFIAVWGYCAVIGFEAPIVRAAIMYTIAGLGQLLGKMSQTISAIIFSGFVMLFLRPAWVVDIGFWLSYVATGSLVLFQKPVNQRLSKVPSFVREDLSTSLAAQIGVAPILFLTFGSYSILSPVVNCLVLWTVAPLSLLGAVAAIMGLVWYELGAAILWLGYPLAWWFVTITGLFK